MRRRTAVPAVEGVLSPAQVTQTAASITAAQRSSGAIPWFRGGHVDPWDHVQSAMALSASGRTHEAERAYEWSRRNQRDDGSWAIRYEADAVVDPHGDANFCAYLATGVWHHWRIGAEPAFLDRMWPVVERAVEFALSLQRVDGAVAWARGGGGPMPEALVTGNASIALSLRCALALADAVGEQRPDWELAAGRIRHTLQHHPEAFEPKPTHAMDWYYPVLGGAFTGRAAAVHLTERWHEFMVADLGCRCVSSNPWVTGAETCELVLALDAMGADDAARRWFAAMQHLREDDGSYWTGLVFTDGRRWPVERTTWTSATVILAADALSRTTAASGLFRGEGLPTCDWEVGEECPCPTSR